MKRDLGIIERIAEKHSDYTEYLPPWLKERLQVIRLLYAQQQEMYITNTHRVENRIVSLSQPWVRPIVRGKQNAEQERYLEWLESGERGDIERRFGINKRCYSLGCITAKLQHTSEVMILMSVLTLNLQRRLRLLLRTFFSMYFEQKIMLFVQ